MISTTFYERRNGGVAIDIKNRRTSHRRNQAKPIPQEQRRLVSQRRRYERETFKIPVRLKIKDQEISGYTHEISQEGLLVFSDTGISPGTPMTLQFSFGENVCSLNISGQVLFCRSAMKERSAQQAIWIKFSAIREFEQKMLTAAAQELKLSPETHQKSLLNILVSKDTMAQEAAGFSKQSHTQSSTLEMISPDRGGVSFELSEAQKALKKKVREFVQKEIVPVAADYDRTGEFPWDIIKKAFELGIFTCYIPKKYGGGGQGIFETAIITEELAAGCMAMGTSIMINLLGVSPLLIAGTEEQKERSLIPYCRQLTLFSFCFTEPDAGSDPSRIVTEARLVGDHYVLNGSKCFITNGGVAHNYIVFATIDKSLGTKGLTAFLTPAKAEGIRIGKTLDKMGQRAANTAEIFFKDVKVPVQNRIGAEGEGYKIGMQSISRSRINVAAGAVGIARTAMEHALRHVQKRVQFNQPLSSFQYVQFRLADMASYIDAAR
jgi:acyl-CoA dehydrogenase